MRRLRLQRRTKTPMPNSFVATRPVTPRVRAVRPDDCTWSRITVRPVGTASPQHSPLENAHAEQEHISSRCQGGPEARSPIFLQRVPKQLESSHANKAAAIGATRHLLALSCQQTRNPRGGSGVYKVWPYAPGKAPNVTYPPVFSGCRFGRREFNHDPRQRVISDPQAEEPTSAGCPNGWGSARRTEES